ncbi:MAG: LysM peptidoglycan-binding domain-containing protein [Thermodesulfovibrionales bacterium]|nr:LysM peptidoglycan-binding domain-containing protein [Thermodesulfovibrionales bacterium]
MRYFCILGLLIFLFAFSVSAAQAEQYEYKDYIVQKGDTLWDITSGELNDAFQWPFIWKENPQVKNPDMIYPGLKIRIPVGRKAVEEAYIETLIPLEAELEAVVEEAPKAEAPTAEVVQADKPQVRKVESVKVDYIVERRAMLYAGYITTAVPYKGEITGSPRGSTRFAGGDDVYLKTAGAAAAGDRFYVIRKGVKVNHPKSKLPLGYLVEVIGTVQVLSVDADGVKARVTEAFSDMAIGDTIDGYYDVHPPYVIGEPRKPDAAGYIVAAKNMRELSAQTDVIHIDKGSKDGLEAGDVLATLFPGTKARLNGVIQLIDARDSTATAVILKSIREIKTGDEFTALK